MQDGTLLRMPSNVTFVLTDWAAHSIGKGRLEPTEAYLPACLRPAPEAPAAAAIASDMPPEQPSGAGGPAGGAAEPGAAAPAEAAAAAAARPATLAEGPASSVVTQPLDEQQLEAALQDVMQPALASQQEQGAESREAAGQRPTVRCRVVRRGAEFVAVEGCKPHFTGGHWAGGCCAQFAAAAAAVAGAHACKAAGRPSIWRCLILRSTILAWRFLPSFSPSLRCRWRHRHSLGQFRGLGRAIRPAGRQARLLVVLCAVCWLVVVEGLGCRQRLPVSSTRTAALQAKIA